MVTLPPPGEPDIYEGLASALIAASNAFLEAEPHLDAALPHLRQAVELDRQCGDILDLMLAASSEAEALLAEGIALLDANPRENLWEARTKFEEMRDYHRRGRALSAGASALTREANAEVTKGLTIWREGTNALRTGLERATVIFQEVRRHQTNGDTPEAAAA